MYRAILLKPLTIQNTGLGCRIYDIESLVVRSETEALLLEQNLIKLHRPPYNIMLRDDKSYVYIFVSADKPYPRIAGGRGKGKHQIGKFFGPYPSAYSARDTLLILQNSLMYVSVKIVISLNVNAFVYSIKSSVVPHPVWV